MYPMIPKGLHNGEVSIYYLEDVLFSFFLMQNKAIEK